MFWKFFRSDARVQEALEQSVGYDISPNVLKDGPQAAPAEADQGPLRLWTDYSFIMPANAEKAPAAAKDELRAHKKKA